MRRCLVEGRLIPATVVDHVEPHRGDERLFWDQDQWQGLCKQHHDAKTVREGRWGQRQLSDGTARSIYGRDVHGMPLDPDHPWNRPSRGVGSVAGRPANRDPAAAALCVAAKFGRGVSGALCGGIAEFLPATAPRFVASL